MPFDPNTPIHQGNGPRCGAACAVYVSHWLADVDLAHTVDPNAVSPADELDRAMRHTQTTRCTEALGSTPANIASYIKNLHPNARIYAPTEIITNWSSRPWYVFLRGGLSISGSTNWSCGCTCAMPAGGALGTDYMIVSMVSKALPSGCGEYFQSHFVVHINDNQVMDPNGHIRQKANYLRGGYCSRGWASVGLDLYVYKPHQAVIDV